MPTEVIFIKIPLNIEDDGCQMLDATSLQVWNCVFRKTVENNKLQIYFRGEGEPGKEKEVGFFDKIKKSNIWFAKKIWKLKL